MFMKQLIAAIALAACLAACSPESAKDADNAVDPANRVAPPVAVPPPPPATLAPADPNQLTLQGLGTLRLDRPVPEAGSWAERGAQASDACRTVTSPDFPGVYAIVEGGTVRRITIGGRSGVKLAEGIGIGAGEAEVRGAFPGFREEPHKYVDAPAKYLTAPQPASGEPALRFEIGADGKVALIYVGIMPVLAYVEGCS